MAKRSVERMVRESRAAWERFALWYDIVSEAYLYSIPGLDPYMESGGEPALRGERRGQRRHDHLFDGTLGNSAEKLANRMVAEQFTAGSDWAEMQKGPLMGAAGQPPARATKALQSLKQKIFQAIHASNFYLSVNAMALDAVVAGTGIMKVGIESEPVAKVRFDAVSQAEVALEGNHEGAVRGYYRKMDLTREEMLAPDMWPEASGIPADEDKDRAPKKHRVLEVTYEDLEESLWRYAVILMDGSGDRGVARQVIYERDYHVCPWICWRYSLLPGETRGRGPVFKAVPAARTVNHAKRIRLESASIRAVPSYTCLSDDVFNPRTVQMAPGLFIPVGSNDPQNPTIRAMEVAGDVQMNEIIIEDERAEIRTALLDAALPDPTGAVRSPTEIIERQRDAQHNLGSPYLRMTEEVGRPVLRAVAYLLGEAGKLPELAEHGQKLKNGVPAPLRLDGTDVAVQFVSPLVLAQQLADAQAIVRWAEAVAGAFGPQALMAGAVVEDAAQVLGEKMAVPAELIREVAQRGPMLEQAMAGGGQPAQPQGAM